jgi:predicted enzyme involved in methoxymalonyl-ACP biosynthesis
VRALAADPARACLTLRCTDRIGDYGLIGFAVLDLATGDIAEFFMSCRVQRKRVERAFFALAARWLCKAGYSTIRVRFRRTKRNAEAAEMLSDLGFAEGDDGLWSRAAAAPFTDTAVVRVRAVEPRRTRPRAIAYSLGGDVVAVRDPSLALRSPVSGQRDGERRRIEALD